MGRQSAGESIRSIALALGRNVASISTGRAVIGRGTVHYDHGRLGRTACGLKGISSRTSSAVTCRNCGAELVERLYVQVMLEKLGSAEIAAERCKCAPETGVMVAAHGWRCVECGRLCRGRRAALPDD